MSLQHLGQRSLAIKLRSLVGCRRSWKIGFCQRPQALAVTIDAGTAAVDETPNTRTQGSHGQRAGSVHVDSNQLATGQRSGEMNDRVNPVQRRAVSSVVGEVTVH